MAASKDNARAILSYATPNPVGPYKLVTPIAPPTGVGKTKTPILPVMGGTLVNVPTPIMPIKQTTPVAPPLPGRLVNVPTQQGRVVDKASDQFIAGLYRKSELSYGPRLSDKQKEQLERALDAAPQRFRNDPKLANAYEREIQSGYFSRKGGLMPRGLSKEQIEKLAAQNIYMDMDRMRRLGIPVENIPDIISTKETWKAEFGFGDFVKWAEFTRRERATPQDLEEVIGNDLKSLDKAGRETYIALMPSWTGTHNELADAARSLSK